MSHNLQSTPDNEFMTLNDIRMLLRMSDSAVRRLVKSRALPAVRIGGAIRVRKAALDEFLRRLEEEGSR